MRFYVYGTLRKGGSNEGFMKGLGFEHAQTLNLYGFTLRYANGLPYAQKDRLSGIVVDKYEPTKSDAIVENWWPKALMWVDGLEGVYWGHYERITVSPGGEEGYMYIAGKETKIPSSAPYFTDWLSFRGGVR